MSDYSMLSGTPTLRPGERAIVPISQEKDVGMFITKMRSFRDRRYSIEREWKLNLAFYKGNQYAWYNRRSDRIESLPTEEGDKPRWRVRLVDNRILGNTQTYVSQLTKTKPQLYAVPSSGSDFDLRTAQVAEALEEYWWQELDLSEKLKEALIWSCIGANGWWKITWDSSAGKMMTFTMDPNQQIITDERIGMLYKENLMQQEAQMGLQPGTLVGMFVKTVGMGEIRVENVSPFDVWTDPSAKTMDEAAWAVCRHSMTPEDIKARYGVDIKADSHPRDYDVASTFLNRENNSGTPTVKPVYIAYFKPNPSLPKGRYCGWVEGPNKFLFDEPWPYPHSMLPLVKFPGLRVPGRIEDEAIITHARPIQKYINRTISQITEYQNMTVNPQMLSPSGSIRQKLTNEPGVKVEYNAVNGLEPKWRDVPALPSYIFQKLEDSYSALDRIFGLTTISRGEVPPNVEAGVAIDLLAEMAVDQLSMVTQGVEAALPRAGKLMLSLAQKYYVEARTAKIYGEGGRIVIQKFQNAEIDAGVDFRSEAGSGMPRTRAGRLSRIKELVALGQLRPDQALKYMDVADFKGVRGKITAQESHADRENDKILRGEPLNPEQAQQAFAYLQQGINPETGEPVENPEDIQMLFERAKLWPGPADIHPIHMDSLSNLIMSVEFDSWPPDARQRLFMHYGLHQELSSAPPQPEPQAVRTSLSIHGTMGPTGTSKMLEQAGVSVTPEEAAEAPLESVVIDTIDKPDADEAGNDPLTEEELTLYKLTAAKHEPVQAALKTQQEMEKTKQQIIKTQGTEDKRQRDNSNG